MSSPIREALPNHEGTDVRFSVQATPETTVRWQHPPHPISPSLGLRRFPLFRRSLSLLELVSVSRVFVEKGKTGVSDTWQLLMLYRPHSIAVTICYYPAVHAIYPPRDDRSQTITLERQTLSPLIPPSDPPPIEPSMLFSYLLSFQPSWRVYY